MVPFSRSKRKFRLSLVIFFTTVAFALLSIPILAAQQAQAAKPAAVSPAPVPAQVFTAKKVFVSNAGGDSDISPDHYSGGPDRAYNQFYAAMKSWGRYDLVSAPVDAELIFELHFTAPIGPVDVMKGNGGSGQRPQFRLVIMECKTHVVLWTFIEYLAVRGATHDQSFDRALAKLVDDVQKLAVPTATAANATK